MITEATSKRRDKLEIISEILEVARDGTLKTQIMYKANLSFLQLTEYLEYMLKTRLMIKFDVNTKGVYVVTEKGLDFLQRHSELMELLNDEDGNAKNGRNDAKVPPHRLLRKA